MKRAALYVRVSTQEQKKHGLSVDSQIQALNDYCLSNGMIVAGLYNDAGISARKKYTRRPALLNLIEDIKANKIDIILFTKLDRWFRSVADYYEVQKILDEYKIPWRAIWEDYETETSAGVFKVNIMLSVAQSEADRTSERIKAVNEYKISKGGYVGSAPHGYKVVKDKLVVDEEEKEAVHAFFNTFLQTYSMHQALKAAAENGLKLERAHGHRLIKYQVYTGVSESGHKTYQYITPEQRDEILTAMERRTRISTKKHEYLFSGLVFCGYCGKRMSAKTVRRVHVDGSEVFWQKYECHGSYGFARSCPALNISEQKIESYLMSYLDEHIKKYNASVESEAGTADFVALAKKKSDLEGRLKRIAIMFEDGDIDINSYREKRDAIKAELSTIRFDTPKKIDVPAEWKEIYSLLDKEHKRRFWARLLSKIVVTNENKTALDIYFL